MLKRVFSLSRDYYYCSIGVHLLLINIATVGDHQRDPTKFKHCILPPLYTIQCLIIKIPALLFSCFTLKYVRLQKKNELKQKKEKSLNQSMLDLIFKYFNPRWAQTNHQEGQADQGFILYLQKTHLTGLFCECVCPSNSKLFWEWHI